MKHNSIKILFLISRTRKRKDGKVPIICRLTFASERKQFYTGLYIPFADWSSKKQEIYKGKYGDLNANLNIIRQQVNQSYLKLSMEETAFTVQDIFQLYANKNISKKHMVLDIYLEFNERQKMEIGFSLTDSTYRKYLETKSHLSSYVKKQYSLNDLELQSLKGDFLKKFELYLKKEKGLQQSTVNKTIQRFRTVLKFAMAQGYLNADPFIEFKYNKVKNTLVYLSIDELRRIENFTTDIHRVEKVRDLFVFCCYTGLAYTEMNGLLKEDLYLGFDDKLWIKVRRQKTYNSYNIPLLPQAEVIAIKYDLEGSPHVFPKISNQRFNAYLKEIADLCRIKKNLTHHVARKTFATTILLSQGASMEVTSKMLGHRSMKTTQAHYGVIVDQLLSEAMFEINKKLN